jgi:hypothetical protein
MQLSELRTSKKLAAHATNVMYSLTCAIDNLDDPLCLKELLIKLGKNHGRHKVTEKEFHVSIQATREDKSKTKQILEEITEFTKIMLT